jgi:hypothetical protein
MSLPRKTPSQRKIQSARANGARSRGPVSAEGKRRSAQNAMRHGLLAHCVVLKSEESEGFEALLNLHLDRLRPSDGVEFGFIEEMVGSYWRMRRAWTIETRMLQNHIDNQPGADEVGRLAAAFENLSSSQAITLIHRYETRLHCMYQRALRNLLLLRQVGAPNEPSPISEHLEPAPDPALDPAPAPALQPPALPAPGAPPGAPESAGHRKLAARPRISYRQSRNGLRRRRPHSYFRVSDPQSNTQAVS